MEHTDVCCHARPMCAAMHVFGCAVRCAGVLCDWCIVWLVYCVAGVLCGWCSGEGFCVAGVLSFWCTVCLCTVWLCLIVFLYGRAVLYGHSLFEPALRAECMPV